MAAPYSGHDAQDCFAPRFYRNGADNGPAGVESGFQRSECPAGSSACGCLVSGTDLCVCGTERRCVLLRVPEDASALKKAFDEKSPAMADGRRRFDSRLCSVLVPPIRAPFEY